MYISRKMIFVHIPKTGGIVMLRLLERLERQLGFQAKRFHGTIQDNRSKLMEGNKPILAFVRNPYSWYVSWYFALQGYPEGSSVIIDLINTKNFNHDMNTLFDMFEGGKLADDYIKQHEGRKYPKVADYSNIDTFKHSAKWDNCGLLSCNYHWLIFGNENIDQHDYTNITIGKQENSVEDKINFFNKIEVLTPRLEAAIRRNARRNITQGKEKDYRTYYDDNLIERVTQKEKYIIDRYGYSFDDFKTHDSD